MNQYVILLIAKSTVILSLAFLLVPVLRHAAASTRYTLWALTFASIVALPVAIAAVPSWRVAIAAAPTMTRVTQQPVTTPALTSSEDVTTPAPLTERVDAAVTRAVQSVDSSGALPGPAVILLIWLVGALLIAARIVAGRYSLRRLSAKATPFTSDEWISDVRRESSRLGVQREVNVLASDRVSTPLAFGIRSPVILLPRDSESWTRDHRLIVLRHELAHIARGDALICVLSAAAGALYWFNPLVWIAARKLRTEQERSCDDRVLALGTPATDYAEHLLEVARSAKNIGMHSLVSVAMARPSQLEGRLLAVLQSRRRGSLGKSRLASITAIAFGGLIALSAFQPVRAHSAIVVASQADSQMLLNTVAPERKAEPRIEPQPSVAKSETAVDSLATGDVAVSSGGTLVLDLKTGASVRIVGTDEKRVRMRATLAGRDWRNTIITTETEGSGARISTDYRDRHGNHSSSHRIEITVPRRFNVQINSAGGDVFIRDVEGDFRGTTGGGEINIRDARGSARLSTGGGPVNVTNSSLSGSVSTGGGGVLIQGVSGGLTGHSGSGGVFYGDDKVKFAEVSRDGMARTVDGKLFVNKGGGSVHIGDAPKGATINTGGGGVTIGDADGDVVIITGGGDVTIGSASKSAKVTTGAGDVKITMAGSGGYPVQVESGNGTVTITLPRDFSADLDLETAFTKNHGSQTRIESDWPLNTTVTPEWSPDKGTPRRYVRARQAIGNGGARITVTTVNGDIIIRRR